MKRKKSTEEEKSVINITVGASDLFAAAEKIGRSKKIVLAITRIKELSKVREIELSIKL